MTSLLLAILGGVLGLVVGWRVFPLTISVKDVVTRSWFQMLDKRIGTAVTGMFVGGFIGFSGGGFLERHELDFFGSPSTTLTSKASDAANPSRPPETRVDHQDSQDHSLDVANFSTGRHGSNEYEQLALTARNGIRDEITYTYGSDYREVALRYYGTDTIAGDQCFRVLFPNGLILYVIPRKRSLEVIDGKGTYRKIFRWQYEGAVDGVGTYCDSCLSEDASFNLVENSYME